MIPADPQPPASPVCRLCGGPVVLGFNPRRAVACDLAGRWVHVDCRVRRQAAERAEGPAAQHGPVQRPTITEGATAE